MRTIIHIGQHKTGTTSLQYYLQNNRAGLERAGLYVPISLAGYKDPSHFILNVLSLNENRYSSMKEMLERARPREYFVNLKRDLEVDISRHYRDAKKKGCKDIIWSNEGLYLLNSVEEYERLKSFFEGYSSEIVCVCCFREKETYRLSRIEELKKQGLALSDDKDSYRYLNADSWLLDYARKEELMKLVFSKAIVFPYDAMDIVKLFMKNIGYSVDADAASIRKNVTKY